MTEVVLCDNQYVDQSHDDLQLFVGSKVFQENKELFRIHSESEIISCFGFVIIIYILGESHAVSVRCGDKSLDEIIACTNVKVGVEPLLLRDMPDNKRRQLSIGGFDYSFFKTRCTYDLNYSHKLISPDQNEGKLFSLEYNFCTDKNCGHSIEPKTIVGIVVKENELSIFSEHHYPEEQAVVRTGSRIEVVD